MYHGSFKGHRLDLISAILERHGSRLTDFAEEYGEPGYENDGDGLILFADWNPVPSFIQDSLRRRGYRMEWLDEWIAKHVRKDDTRKAYRTTGDCWQWKPYYLIHGGEVIGGDEIEEDADIQEWYVNEYLANDPERVNLFDIDLSEYGFEKHNGRFENGWHPGQNDRPPDIFRKIREEHPEADCINGSLSNSQFDMKFTVWFRPAEEREPATA